MFRFQMPLQITFLVEISLTLRAREHFFLGVNRIDVSVHTTFSIEWFRTKSNKIGI